MSSSCWVIQGLQLQKFIRTLHQKPKRGVLKKLGVKETMRDVRDYWLMALAILAVVLIILFVVIIDIMEVIIMKGMATTLQHACGVGG